LLSGMMKWWFNYTEFFCEEIAANAWVEDKIRKQSKKAQVIVTDKYYYLATQKSMNSLLQMNLFKFAKFKNETRDCDDYSFASMAFMRWITPGFAFGIVHVDVVGGGKHALNFFLDDEGRLYYFEPQTNEVILVAMENKYKPYLFII